MTFSHGWKINLRLSCRVKRACLILKEIQKLINRLIKEYDGFVHGYVTQICKTIFRQIIGIMLIELKKNVNRFCR